MNIGEVYDSVEAAVSKWNPNSQQQEEGSLDPDSANAIVQALRDYVQFIMDYKLADSYKHFTENKDRIDEAPPPVGGVAPVGGNERRTPAGVKGRSGGTGTPEGPKGTYTKRGAQGAAVDSETIKGLESNVFPALLALSGVAGALAGTLVQTDWFRDLVTETVPGKDKAIQGVVNEDALKTMETKLTPQPGEGASQMLGRVLEGNPDAFGPDAPVEDMLSAMKQSGVTAEDLSKLSADPEKFMSSWEAALERGGTMSNAFPGVGGVAAQAGQAAWDSSNLNVQAASSLLNNMNPTRQAAFNSVMADLGFPNLTADVAGPNLAQALAQGSDGMVNIANPSAGSQLNAIAQALGQMDATPGTAAVAAQADPTLGLQLGKSVTSTLVKTVKKQVMKTFIVKGAGTTKVSALGAKAIAAGPLLQALGVGLIASGAAVKLIRMKGLKSSRAQMLRDLSIELQPFPGNQVTPDPCEEVLEELTQKFKTGMLVRYMEEKGRGNVTGMKPGEGAGGETLITKIVAMPGEGDIPSIEEQKESDSWKNEKVIFVGVQGMVPLEAGSRRSAMNSFRAAAIRDCALNIQVPTDEELALAYENDQRMAKRLGIEKPEGGAADLGDKQKRMVDLKNLDRALKSLDRKLPDGVEPLTPAQLRAAKVLLARTSKEAGGAQRFTMQEEEGEEKSTLVPLKKLIRALVNDLRYPPETDDPEADDVLDKEAFSAKPGSPGAVRLANFIRAASSSRVGVMFGYNGKPLKGDLKKRLIKHLTKQKLKESTFKGWKLLPNGAIRRVDNEKK
jgi:hypothetical protein